MTIPTLNIADTSPRRRLSAIAFSIAAALSIVIADSAAQNAAPEEVGMNSEALAALDASMRDLVETGRRAGVVWGVAKDGKVVNLNAYGMRDIDAGLPMETDTVFRLYSQTRPVTGVAVLMLVDEGKLSLDDHVASYIPAFGKMRVISEIREGIVTATEPQRTPMTIRHLLSYTSGLGYGRAWPKSVGANHRDILALDGDLESTAEKISKLPLLAQPGERWIYGYHSDVLARIVEIASEQTFDQFLRKRLFDPLGMDDTGFWVQRGGADRLATVYEPQSSEPGAPLVEREAVPSSSYTAPGSFFSGGGGLVSTAHDYLRFAQMLANGGTLDGVKILEPETVKAMGANMLANTATPVVYDGYRLNPPSPQAGYGWGLSIGVRLDGETQTVPGAPGDMTWGGLANTTFFVDPTNNLVAVAMSQYMGPDGDVILFRLRDGVYNSLKDE